MIPREKVAATIGKPVLYDGTEYILKKYILHKPNGKLMHSVEIEDKNGNSVIQARLEDVEEKP